MYVYLQFMAAIALPDNDGGGYDYQFVKTPSDTLICIICYLPSKEPFLSVCCGHTFCKACLGGSRKFSNVCPMCRSDDFATIFNKQADRVIRSLHVFCTNKEQGCGWQGEVNDISSHLGNCLIQIVNCPNGCRESLQRQYLITHVVDECPRRMVNCWYCNVVGEHQFIKGQHQENCPKFPVECPNRCEVDSICRDKVEEHSGICPLEIIPCDYHVVGCQVRMARRDASTHKQEMMEEHLSLSIKELMETKRQSLSIQSKFKHEVEKIKDDLAQQHLQVEKDLTAKFTTSQMEAKRIKEELLQKLTVTEKELNTTKQQLASVCQNLIKAENEHTTLATSTDKAFVEVVNRFRVKITAAENRFKVKIIAAENKISDLESKLQQKIELIEGIFGPWLTSLHNQASLDDQVVPVIVKMTNFFENVKTTWISKPFYNNHSKEYKLQLRVISTENLLGDPWMSVSLVVDPIQPKIDRFSVKLLNQIDNNEHYMTKSYYICAKASSVIWCSRRFISFENLRKKTATYQYLKDDTLFLKVLIS